jgi:hypothetical protein
MPFAEKITAAAKGQAADFTAEEQDALKTVATAATKIISQSQNFTAEELANNANVLANAKGLQKVAERMGAMVVANDDADKNIVPEQSIITLRNPHNTFPIIDDDKNNGNVTNPKVTLQFIIDCTAITYI